MTAPAKPNPTDQDGQNTPELPEFFAVVAPGFEMLAAKELEAWHPEIEIEVARGGLLFQAPLVVGCELNRKLKIPNRILLRLTSFTCRDFPKLFKKASVFPWEQWIPNGADAEFHASAHASRVSIKKRIEETCFDGFKKRTKNRVLKPTRSLDVYVRLDQDVCTISIDTSGEILHKRGTRALTSEAPIRETIAAGLLFWMIATHEDENAGARLVKTEDAPAVTLVDPMMGSGTFFLEASGLDKLVETRRFAYEEFPRFQREADSVGGELDSHEMENPSSSQTSISTLTSKEKPNFKNPFQKFVGLELDAKAVATTAGNLKSLSGYMIEALQGDIFETKPLGAASVRAQAPSLIDQSGARADQTRETAHWLIANPPYGERLKIEGSLKDYYEKLFAACDEFARPTRACFVLPETAAPTKIRAPRDWKLVDHFRFQNGGLPVVALQFVRA